MKNKYGFTLAELLIAIGIIGILTTVALISLKPFDKGVRYLHSNTYYALNRAYYNVMLYWQHQGENADNKKPFADDLTHNADTTGGDQGAIRLCQGLTEFINSVEGNDLCTTAKPVDITKLDDVNTMKTQFDNEHLMFTAVNGVRYFISSRLGGGEVTEDSEHPYFYLIFADVNGTRYPNSLEYKPAWTRERKDIVTSGRKEPTDPDIFTFAALNNINSDNGNTDATVIPIGISEFENRYMLTRIMHSDENGEYMKYSTPSKPYYISKCEAWGYYNQTNNNVQIYSDQNEQRITVNQDNPYTYNDYVRSVIKTNSSKNNIIIKNLEYLFAAKVADGELSAGNRNMWNNSCNLTIRDNDYHCASGDESACQVIIDKYVY